MSIRWEEFCHNVFIPQITMMYTLNTFKYLTILQVSYIYFNKVKKKNAFFSLYPIDSVSLDRVKSGDIHIYIYLFHSFFADVLPSAFLPLYVGSAYITLKTSLKSLC